MRGRALLLIAAVAGLPAVAQQSASYRLEGSVFNAGGAPNQGSSPSSSSFRVRLVAVGDAAVARSLARGSFGMDAGFTAGYPPAGEVRNLRFGNVQTLAWDPESSIGTYNLYRGAIGTLPGTYGACLQAGLTAASATDASAPPSGGSWFYLVTAENRLREEGTKGLRSNGAERGNGAPCP